MEQNSGGASSLGGGILLGEIPIAAFSGTELTVPCCAGAPELGGRHTPGGSLRIIPLLSVASGPPWSLPCLQKSGVPAKVTGSKCSTLQNLLAYVALELCDDYGVYFFSISSSLIWGYHLHSSTVHSCGLLCFSGGVSRVSQEFGQVHLASTVQILLESSAWFHIFCS